MGDNPHSIRIDPEIAARNGWTPLHFAASSDAGEAAQVLLENGARVSRRDADGDTVLQVSQTMFDVHPLLEAALAQEDAWRYED